MACKPSERMRCRASVTLCKAPSATCSSDMPSLALRVATFSPRTCEVRRLEICSPAASSLALLMRCPVDRRCNEVPSAVLLLSSWRHVNDDEMLVLTVSIYVRTRSTGRKARCHIANRHSADLLELFFRRLLTSGQGLKAPIKIAGSTRASFRLTFQCRCGPVARPVAPTLPSTPPRGSSSPTFTPMAERWQNMLIRPWP